MATGYLLNGMTVAVQKLNPANSQFVTLEGIKGTVTFPSAEVDEIEITSHGSTRREYIAGLKDSGSIEFNMNWLPKSPTDVLLTALVDTGEQVNVKITTPGLAGNTSNLYSEVWRGFVRNYERNAPHDDVAEASVEFRISEKITV